MGLFGSKKKTYVSSTLYNLAGDPTGKPTFKRTAVASAIVRGSDIPGDMRNAYLSGFAISLRSFGRWSETSGYNQRVSMAKSDVALQSGFSSGVIQQYLQEGLPPTTTVEVLSAGAGAADISLWADSYVVNTFLAGNTENWRTELEFDYAYDEDSNVLNVMIGPTPAEGVEDTRTKLVAPSADYDPLGSYVYAVYRENTAGQATGSLGGEWITIDGIVANEPNLTGWTLTSGYQNQSTPVELTTQIRVTRKTAAGAVTEDPVQVSKRTEHINVTRDVWGKTEYVGGSKTNTLDLENEMHVIERDYSYQIETRETVTVTQVAGGEFSGAKTTVTTREYRQVLVPLKRYRKSSSRVTTRRYGPLKMLLYKVGSGVAVLDGLVQQSVSDIDWLPFIPIRLNNVFVRDFPNDDLHEWCTKAFRKAFGRRTKIDTIIESLEDNKSLKDIDFAHIAFGVSLNTKSQWGKQYIYEYLRQLSTANGHQGNSFTEYNRQYKTYTNYVKAMQEWNTSQESSWGLNRQKPVVVEMPVRPKGRITFRSTGAHMHFHQVFEYEFLYEETGAGRLMVEGKPAAIGQMWWEVLDDAESDAMLEDMRNQEKGAQGFISRTLSKYHGTVALHWQDTSRSWRRMVVRGGLHINYPYGTNSIKIYATDALKDKEESGFFFPLNMAIFRKMGIVDGTEMHNCSAYLILNSYKVVKKKWYQTGIFAVIVAIVVVVVSIYFPPAGGAAGGVLGTNVAVGTAIVGAGASAAVIAMVGAVANAIAGAILGAILTRVATKVFGNSILGQIFAVAAVMMIGNYQSAASNGSAPLSFSESFGSMMRAENLLKLSMSAVNGYSEYINKSTMHILTEAKELQEAYSAETRRIQEMYVEQFGAGKVIDPMAFTTAGQGRVESADTFLSRTLMTGMDIAETTHNMLSEFASLTLTLDTKV